MPTIRFLLLALCAAAALPLTASNPIQIENAKPGDGDWRLFSEAQGEIEGYGSEVSVNQGESISFFVNTTAASYNLDIFRMGWYGGEGGRRMAPTVTRTGRQQTIPTPDPETGLTECNWTDPYTITIPSDWISGVYLVKLTTLGTTTKNKYILFVVREDSRQANHNFQLTVTTSQAYNNWGGKSLYARYSDNGEAARKVSFNRPYADGSGTGIFMWRWEYNAVRFLEREGFDVIYTTNIDTHRRGHLLLNAKTFLSFGHDEYWSWEMRENVEEALAVRVNLAFFSANNVYWQVRFEPSPITGQQDRTMVAYKEVALQSDPYATDNDPTNDSRITTQFRLPPVSKPESALLGVQFIYYPVNDDIVIDDVTSAPWVFAETELTTGSKLQGLLGYEVDAMTEHSPPGTIRLGRSPVKDEGGNTIGYSHMTVYSTGSTWVFSTGSIQWAWGLDSWNGANHPITPVSPAAQQITRNILRQFAGSSAARDCQITIDPKSATVSAAAGSGTISLQTASHCTWSIASSAAWLTVTSATSGTGPATIAYQYSSNAGSPARAATLTIGDKTFSLSQQSGCAYNVSPASASIGAAGGTVAFNITTTAACSWTASTSKNWLSIASAPAGFGSATVSVSVANNEGPERDASVFINGTAYNVNQANGCMYAAQPGSISLPGSGGDGEIAITTDGECFWRASSANSWIIITSGGSGQGPGVMTYTVTANTTGSPRTGTIIAAGVSITIRQSADNCVYEFSPLWASHTSGASTGTITVTTECPWEAVVESGGSYITITEQTPTGVKYAIAANTKVTARSGTIRIAGRAINITQNGTAAPIFALSAVATSATTASLSWSTVSGATSYEIYRSSNAGSFGLVTSTTGSAYSDIGLSSNRTYLYRIRAVGSSGAIAYSIIDPATTVMFTDATITPGVTKIKDVHIEQLRIAVTSMLSAGGLPSQPFTDPALSSSVTIKAAHVDELRNALARARAAIGLPPVSWSVPELSVVRASHITDLRTGVQ